ncbi:MAG TPA: hypothetical protein VFQ65_09910 [Kofleriaceae bacterium]|nr:hypothetical protein [Kofleriaceae bacterium]
MKRALVILCLVLCGTANAHVGSPDVFFEGDAGPYRLFVTIRTPQVIPGIATIEIRSEAADVTGITVVPMRLTGPGSDLPPAADRADRSTTDPKFFTTSLWLMEHGSMQVRIVVTGGHGQATLSVPVPAYAQKTLAMPSGLGALLLGLMTLLALAIVAILVGALREAALEPGVVPSHSHRIALAVISLAVVGLIVLGKLWWGSVAADYEQMVMKPWQPAITTTDCRIHIPVHSELLPDHGHDMHLFLVRMPAMDRLAHLHPTRDDSGFGQDLPSLPAGHYQVFADIVLPTGFPITGTAAVDLSELHCPAVAGDDTVWAAGDALANGARMIWDRPRELRAGVAQALAFRVVESDGSPSLLEPYMGMAAHAEVIRSDASVFAHLHPNGSVAMPALELASSKLAMPGMEMAMPMSPISATLTFPFGFPRAGDYKLFIQIKRAGVIETASFDAHVVESLAR